jgi:hypothetical protein
VVGLLLKLYAVSGDTRFVHLADEYDDDYSSTASGTIQLSPGIYTAYSFPPVVKKTKGWRLRASAAMTRVVDQRGRISGKAGWWFRIASGAFKGRYLQEVPARVYYRGVAAALVYPAQVPVTLKPGRIRGEQIGALGAIIATKTVSISVPTKALVTQKAVVNGVPEVLVASGPLSGFWVPRISAVLP